MIRLRVDLDTILMWLAIACAVAMPVAIAIGRWMDTLDKGA